MVTHLIVVEIVSIKMLKQNYNAQYYNRPIQNISFEIYRHIKYEKHNIVCYIRMSYKNI